MSRGEQRGARTMSRGEQRGGRLLGTVFATAAAAAGCAHPPAPVGLTHDELVARLAALPGVTVTEQPADTPDYTYFVLEFTQPVDHDDPGLGTFQEKVSLLHRDTVDTAPVVVVTTGYGDGINKTLVELTQLLDANQVSIEHRYYGASKPAPCDWSRLTIWQMAEDEHAVIEALKTVYAGAFVTTGASKGGMTALFHRRYHPDDVAGTVAYVTPLSFDAPDGRYADLGRIGPLACNSFVHDVATEILANRREAMEDMATAELVTGKQLQFNQIEIGPAVEAAIMSLEWTFWQIRGEDACSAVPKVTDDDAAMYQFLKDTSNIANFDDTGVTRSQPYYYQAYSQLGYPDYGTEYLVPYREYSDADYTHNLPTQEPRYDASAMQDIASYVRTRGDHLLFVYGEWDPWTAGQLDLGAARDAASFVQPHGTHMVNIVALERSDKDAAFSKLRAWTGVTPIPGRVVHVDNAAIEGVAAEMPVTRRTATRAPK